jgi:hypothetical protein
VYRLSTTLASRLVLNLREQNSVLEGLPTSIETQGEFQAALPIRRNDEIKSVIDSVWADNSTFETVSNRVVGGSR